MRNIGPSRIIAGGELGQ